jgi:hypothetical protein
MAGTNLVISITNAPGDSTSFVSSTDPYGTVQRLINLLRQIEAGSPTSVTLATLTGATAASGTVTFSLPCSVADTVTINNKAVTAAQLAARGTAIFATIVDGNVLTIKGVALTAKNTVTDSVNQFAIGANDTAAVGNCVAVINAHPQLAPFVVATADTSTADKTVKIKAVTEGTAANAYTLTRTGAPITVSGVVLSGGAAASGDQFDYGDTANQAAVSLTAAITRSATAGLTGVVTAAVTATGVATVSAAVAGLMGNAITLAKSGANISVSPARLAGGAGTSASFTF